MFVENNLEFTLENVHCGNVIKDQPSKRDLQGVYKQQSQADLELSSRWVQEIWGNLA